MKERGILFSAPMVRALLAGTKTQTRRPLTAQPMGTPFAAQMSLNKAMTRPVFAAMWDTRGADGSTCCICPYGVVGDRLWVRETWAGPLVDSEVTERAEFDWRDYQKPEFCRYAADGGPRPEYMDADDNLRCRWTPAIHMFRWASRITLEITEVRVERLTAISEADAIAEGIERCGGYWRHYADANGGLSYSKPVNSYASLWESINGAGSWDANPWVWALTFKALDTRGAARNPSGSGVTKSST